MTYKMNTEDLMRHIKIASIKILVFFALVVIFTEASRFISDTWGY